MDFFSGIGSFWQTWAVDPLSSALTFIYEGVGSYAIAIILFTVAIRVLMIPLIFLGNLPLPLSAFGQAVLVMALAGPAIAVLFTLPNAIVADIVDRDEEQTGQRREAIYFGVQGLIVKAGLGLGIGLAAVELDMKGFAFVDGILVEILDRRPDGT